MNDSVVNTPGGLPSKSKSYGLVQQNNATNQAYRLNSKRNSKQLPLNKTQVSFKDVTALFTGKKLGTSEAQMLEYINYKHTNAGNYDNNLTVEFTLKEYMKDFALKDTKSARTSLRRKLDVLIGLQLSYSGGDKKNPYNQSFGRHNLFSGYDYKKGVTSISYTPEMNTVFTKQAIPMPIHLLLFRLNPKTEATSYYILEKILENKRQNAKNHPGRMDRIKVTTLIENCPNLPTYDEVMNGNGNVDDRIIQPLLKGVERLSEAFDYSFVDANGKPVNYENDTSYDGFIKWELIIRWNDYPESYLKQLTTHHSKKKKN